MTPADKRVLDLLDRWLASIELHLKYVDLDEPDYQQVQPWPKHERPSRWILELAQQKVLQLKSLCKMQIANNDPTFAEALELMGFLANLVGAQNINRFIPLANPAQEQPTPITHAPETQDVPAAAVTTDVTRHPPGLKQPTPTQEPEHTREMPKLKMPAKRPAARHAAEPQSRRPPPTAKQASESDLANARHIQEIVIADAVRLLEWGKEWHELPELIARMAGRPPAAEIRRILRTCKQRIEAQVRS